MKKRLLMISTFLLSFIILITNVNAAQELTCAYGDGEDGLRNQLN